MDQETANELVAGGSGLLQLGDRTFVVSPPTDADMATLAGELRRLAKLKAVSPLAAVMEEFDRLPPAMREMAVKAAVGQGGKAQAEPTSDQMAAQLYDAEGIRFWVWWLARKEQPALTLKDLEPLVTPANVLEVLVRLQMATKLERLDPLSPGQPSLKAG